MTSSLHRELADLKTNLLKMASMVEVALENAMQALSARDGVMASSVIEKDDEINAMENFIDQQCLKLLALKQPMAIDLRLISMAMKINLGLERIGDQAVNIAERTLLLIEEPLIIKPFGLNRLARISEQMLRDSMDAFVNRDVRLAESVCDRDDEADQVYLRLVCDILEHMTEDPSFIVQGVHFTVIAHNLERVADQATNICEDVVYMVEGRVIKHKSLLEPQ
ncbi:MAG: phosphate signaling complex protein PhoU [Deltaproteobacteria bacterium]|nr:phosphate signaling complex protein PhoU [Deltaproteobacteria bacterium]MBW2020537.1 phosphate signaling complex protein PhoU [Deltaproteobacteria bacterium]MBW2073953.1 phosphate signaling complex protein PhoU [Deltaproteobacteria bacterium]RLB82205.1 MAG: phosphate transport system regulatory protein PhoU [Deltaproteobacteria bacterium]